MNMRTASINFMSLIRLNESTRQEGKCKELPLNLH
jgi:hypothetical protein